MSNPAKLTGRERTIYIKKELKKVFPQTKFSVKCDYNSINLDWTDGPTEELVKTIDLHKTYDVRFFFYNRTYSDRAYLLSKIAAAQIIDHEMEKHGLGWTLRKIQEKAWRVFRNTSFYDVNVEQIRNVEIKITRGLIDGMTFNTCEAGVPQ